MGRYVDWARLRYRPRRLHPHNSTGAVMGIYPRVISAIAAGSTATALVIADAMTAQTAGVLVIGIVVGMLNEAAIGYRRR